MFLRIRGKGACPENSQAVVMHARGFRHSNSAAHKGEYLVGSLNKEKVYRPYVFSHFAVGVQSEKVLAAQEKYRDGEESGMSVSEELLLVWKEIWNVYDIIDDKIPLLPENFEGVDKCLAAIKQKNVSSVGESFQDFKLPTSLAGNNKILVATHYLSYEDKKSFVSKVNPNASAAGVAVFDLRQVPASEIHDKLARDLAWLASFASIQVDSVFFSCAAVVVLLPYAVVPSVQELEHCVHANSELAHFAKAVLEMYDFIGEYLSLVNCHSPESPPVFVLGKTETETIQKISESLSPNDNRVFVFHGDHLPAMDALPLAQATSVTVPLKQLNDGEEEAWDPSTQKEMARLNFCPCCGSCDHQH